MKTFDNGCFFTVSVSSNEVADFKTTWPCSGLPTKAIRFQFDKRNGDLVDLLPWDLDGDALAALADDAKAYGAKRLGLTL